jgi:hypothetical protein
MTVIEVNEFDDDDNKNSSHELAPSMHTTERPARPTGGFAYYLAIAFSLPWLGFIWIFLSITVSGTYMGYMTTFFNSIAPFVKQASTLKSLFIAFFTLVNITNLCILAMLVATNKFLLRCCCGRRRESLTKSISIISLQIISWILFLGSYLSVIVIIVMLIATAAIWFVILVGNVSCDASSQAVQEVMIPLLQSLGIDTEAELEAASGKIDEVCRVLTAWNQKSNILVIIAVILILVEIHALLYTRSMVSKIGYQARQKPSRN